MQVNLGSENGQSLIETVVALSVLVVGLLGIVVLLNNSLGLNRVTADNYTATYLAAEGIEVIKNLIDANIIARCPWNSGFTAGSFEVALLAIAQRSTFRRGRASARPRYFPSG